MKYCIQAALYVRKMQRIRATGAREIVTLTVTQAIVKKKVLNFTIRTNILEFIKSNIDFVKCEKYISFRRVQPNIPKFL